jgi:hypothetical protein
MQTPPTPPQPKSMNLKNPAKRIVVGIQFLFVAFGATVLVPLLIDVDPAVALFTGIKGVDHGSFIKSKYARYLARARTRNWIAGFG